MKKNAQISRREALSLLSMGIIVTQIPFEGKGNYNLSELESKTVFPPHKLPAEVMVGA